MNNNILIYKITNKINNKVYIGQTTQGLQTRWTRHIISSKNRVDNYAFHNAINKYGPENFVIEVLEYCEPEDLNEKEKYYIEFYDSLVPKGYNIRLGGDDCGRKAIYQLNLYDNQIVAKYASITEASIKIKGDASVIAKASKNRRATAYGYRWRLVDNYDASEEISDNYHLIGRPVYQLDVYKKQIIKKYSNSAEAIRELKLCQSSFSQCITGVNKTCGGYGWCYVDEYDSYIYPILTKSVAQIDKNTNNIIQIWNSVKDAADTLKIDASCIRAVCNGRQKTSKGFKWRYLDDN